MKRHLRSRSAVILFCLIGPIAARSGENLGQIRSAYYTPTPQTWSFIRYGNTPVDHYTGTARVDVPLYDCQDPDFHITVSAGYASGGFIPQRQTGILGLNWFLDCGGAVTREIRGRDDFAGVDSSTAAEGRTKGFLAGRPSYSDSLLFSLAIGRHNNHTYVCDRNSGHVDSENETDADIFRFNFMGRSGSFHFDGARNLRVYDTGGNHGTYEIELSDCSGNSARSRITIRTDDGYTWIFGGAEGDSAVERWVRGSFSQQAYGNYTFATDRSVADPIVSWMLTTVIAPNGRRMEFTYDTASSAPAYLPSRTNQPGYVSSFTFGVNPFSSDMFVPWDYAEEFRAARCFHRWASIVRTTYLKRISIPGSVKIDFSYSLKNCYDVDAEHFPASFAGVDAVRNYRIVQNLYKLDSIGVFHGGDTLRVCRFAYRIEDDRLILDEADVSGRGKYAFSYYEPHRYAGLMTSDVDFWGYYNGRNNAFTHWMPMDVDADNDEKIVSEARNPDFDYGVCGCLKRIVYPTGGFTEFEYEPHRAEYIVDKRAKTDWTVEEPLRPEEPAPIRPDAPSDPFLAGLCRFSTIFGTMTDQAGGVRIRRVTDHDAAGGRRTREFEYIGSDSRSSGIVLDFPRFVYEKNAYGALVGVLSIQYPANTFDRTHVGYGTVREIAADGSAVEYRFNDYRSHPDDYEGQQRKMITDLFGPGTEFTVNICREPNSRHYRRGKLRTKTGYDAGGNKVTCERMIWRDHTDTYSAYVVDSGPYSFSVKKPVADYRLSALERVEYFGADSVWTRMAYDYNDLGQIRTVTRTLSDERTFVTDIAYLHESAEGVDPQSVPKRYRTQTVESYIPVGKSTDRLLTSAEKRTYVTAAGRVLPAGISRARIVEPVAIGGASALECSLALPYTPLIGCEAYDPCGNPVQIVDAAGTRRCLVWGYGGLYPVAKAVNATWEQVRSALGIDASPLSGALTPEQTERLYALDNVWVEVCDYRPLVGPTRLTDPARRSVGYRYDAFGRLIEERDSLGVIRSYAYHF